MSRIEGSITMGDFEGWIAGMTNAQSKAQAEAIQAQLIPIEVDIDLRRPNKFQDKGKIYFHAIQDVALAVSNLGLPEELDTIRDCQACYLKDLNAYLTGFPESEPQMKKVFEGFLFAGTTRLWEKDPNFTTELNEMFWQVDNHIIRPWADRKAFTPQ